MISTADPILWWQRICDAEFVVDRNLAMGDLEAECEVYGEADMRYVEDNLD